MSAERDRALELLADRTTRDLDAADARELDELLAGMPELDDDAMELAASAALVAMVGQGEPLPASLRARTIRTLSDASPERALRLTEPMERTQRPAAVAPYRSALSWSGWIAAAACLVVALILVGRTNRPPAPISPSQAREAFLAQVPDVRTAPWGDWDSPEIPGVTGSVEWSETAQRGFMRFRGLAANDPSTQQYQLWIIDERGLEQRISGGVFNVDQSTGEVVVEIEPAVEIHNAAAFAITIERPGGVWVSDMTRRVTIASLAG